MSGTGNRARGESAGSKLKQLIQKLPYHIIGIAGAVGESRKVPPQRADKLRKSPLNLPRRQGEVSSSSCREEGKKKNSKKTRKREQGEKEKWQ